MNTSQPTLGTLLKGLRSRQGWTLKEMSDRTGIPFSTLSKVETDRLTLSYDKLLQLSQRLGIQVTELFAKPDQAGEAPVTARRSIGTLDQSIQVTTQNYDYHYMCPELRGKRMVPIVTKIRAKTVEKFGELVRHSGEEYIWVLEGGVDVHTEFYDPVRLLKGESIYIDSTMGHAYVVAPGFDEATILGVCSSSDEALMSSLMGLHGPDVQSGPAQAMAGEGGTDAGGIKADQHLERSLGSPHRRRQSA